MVGKTEITVKFWKGKDNWFATIIKKKGEGWPFKSSPEDMEQHLASEFRQFK